MPSCPHFPLQVEFIFTDPSEDDAPYIRALLHNGTLVKASNSDAAGLAKLVADQVAIGTLIKVCCPARCWTTIVMLPIGSWLETSLTNFDCMPQAAVGGERTVRFAC